MSDVELYPDPTLEPRPREVLPRWFWWALAPVLLIVLLSLAGVAYAFVLVVVPAFEELDRDAFPEPSAADRAAILTAADFGGAFAEGPDAESLQKIHYENDTLGLEYEYDGDDGYVYSSIDEESSVADAEWTYDLLSNEEDEDHEVLEGLFRWGDASELCVYAPSGEPYGYTFVGRRGTRVVWADWGGEERGGLAEEELAEFLAPIVERMADHVLLP